MEVQVQDLVVLRIWVDLEIYLILSLVCLALGRDLQLTEIDLQEDLI